MIGKFIALLVTAAVLALGYHIYTQHTGSSNPGAVNNAVQNAKNAVQQDTNYSNQVKDTVQNQYGQ